MYLSYNIYQIHRLFIEHEFIYRCLYLKPDGVTFLIIILRIKLTYRKYIWGSIWLSKK